MSYSVINASGFGDEDLNGNYYLSGYHDGQAFYMRNGRSFEISQFYYMLIYKNQYGPYSFSPAWYVIEITQSQVGALDPRATKSRPTRIEMPKYKSLTQNLLDNQWVAILDETSNETQVGVIEIVESSSSSSSGIPSSSSSSTSSSSSSSSEGYSESSSSSSSGGYSDSSESSSSSSSEGYSDSSESSSSSSSEGYSDSSESSSSSSSEGYSDSSESSSSSSSEGYSESSSSSSSGGYSDSSESSSSSSSEGYSESSSSSSSGGYSDSSESSSSSSSEGYSDSSESSSSSSSEGYSESSSSSSSGGYSDSSESSSSSSSEGYSDSSESSSSSSSEGYSDSSESSSSSSSEGYSDSSESSSSSSSEGYSDSSESSSSSSSEGYSESSSSSSSFEPFSESSSSSSSEGYSSSSSSSSSSYDPLSESNSFYSAGNGTHYMDTDSAHSSAFNSTNWTSQKVTISFFFKWPPGVINESLNLVRSTDTSLPDSFVKIRKEGPNDQLRATWYYSTAPGDRFINTTTDELDDDNWRHYLFRLDATLPGASEGAEIWIDGVKDSGKTGFNGTWKVPGADAPNGPRFFEAGGYYSEMIITDGWHDATDFADFSGANPCPIEPAVTPLVWYRAEEVTTLTNIPDQSGNGYDAEFFNSSIGTAITTDVTSC